MLVRISDIALSGLKINDTIPLDALNARMNEARDNDITFLEAPRVSVLVTKNASGAEVAGTVTTKYRQPCSWCIKGLERDLEIEISIILQEKPETLPSNDPEAEFGLLDDVGISYYENDHVELEGLIQEQIMLSLDSFYHPEEDKDGNCSKCGLNVKAEEEKLTGPGSTFGDLFKKAGVK